MHKQLIGIARPLQPLEPQASVTLTHIIQSKGGHSNIPPNVLLWSTSVIGTTAKADTMNAEMSVKNSAKLIQSRALWPPLKLWMQPNSVHQ